MKWFSKEASAVICLTSAGVGVLLRWRQQGTAPVFWHAVHDATRDVQAEPAALFRRALCWVKEVAANEFVEIRLCLSDCWLHHRLLELEDFPAERKMRERLVRWRVAQELEVPEETLAVAWQTAATSSRGLHAVYVTAMDSALKQALNDAALEAGYALSHLGSLFHDIHAVAASILDDGMLGWLTDDHWVTLRVKDGSVASVRAQRGEGDEAVSAFQRDLARGVTEHGVRTIRVISDRSREIAARGVAAALADTVVDIDAQAGIATEPGPADRAELEQLAAYVGGVS